MKTKGDFMFFGWTVVELKSNPNIDIFGLLRYQPKISEKWMFFSQAEIFPVYNFRNEFWNVTERFRLGLKINKTAFGMMTDFNQSGKNKFSTTENSGVFLRHDF